MMPVDPQSGPPEGTSNDDPTTGDGRLLHSIIDGQAAIRADFERLAEVIEPVVTRTYAETQARVRALEQRLLSRQERPTVNRLAQLLVSVQRLSSAEDIKAHVEDSILGILKGLGYEQFGEVGEALDEDRHEVLNMEPGSDQRVTVVHNRGLQSFGDIIVRARVDVGGDPGGTAPGVEDRGEDQ